MDRRQFLTSIGAGALGGIVLPGTAAAQEKKNAEVEYAVERGLEHLKKLQAQDGHWESPGGMYPTSITGVAGPGGGSADKPVGLVYIGAVRAGNAPVIERHLFGDIGRAQVRLATIEAALRLLRELI